MEPAPVLMEEASASHVVKRPTRWPDHWEAAFPWLLFLLAIGVYAVVNRGERTPLDYFVPLANSFVHGHLDCVYKPWLGEMSPSHGRWYVIYPPMPALLMVPFVASLGTSFNQSTMAIVLGGLNAALASWVVKRMGITGRRRVIFSLLWAFGTIHWFSAQVGSAWHIAHVCAVMFLFLAIIVSLGSRNPIVMGLLHGAAVMSRLPTLMAVPFFAACLIDKALKTPGDKRRAVLLNAAGYALGLGSILLAYGIYNYVRFDSPFQAGYTLLPWLKNDWQYRYGFFTLHAIPHNLYAMLLKAPNQVENFPWYQPPLLGGLSLFLTTPAFLWAIKARGKDWLTIGAWLAIPLVLMPILLHADPGGDQFGYRYAQDFYPFLFVLAVKGMGPVITFEAWLAITLGWIVNAWGMISTYFHFRA